MNEEKQTNVLIIESLSPTDLLKDLKEARATADVLRTLNINAHCETARSKDDLNSLCRMFENGPFDVLHIACHGNTCGICVTDGDQVPWIDFIKMLGRGIDGRTLVLSACSGGCRQLPDLFTLLNHRPKAIVGPGNAVEWPKLLLGMLVYYRSVFLEQDGVDSYKPCVAVSRAELASGAGLCVHMWNSVTKKYSEHVPSPICSLDVMIRTHGKDAVDSAAQLIPSCCGDEWEDPQEVVEMLASYGISPRLDNLQKIIDEINKEALSVDPKDMHLVHRVLQSHGL